MVGTIYIVGKNWVAVPTYTTKLTQQLPRQHQERHQHPQKQPNRGYTSNTDCQSETAAPNTDGQIQAPEPRQLAKISGSTHTACQHKVAAPTQTGILGSSTHIHCQTLGGYTHRSIN